MIKSEESRMNFKVGQRVHNNVDNYFCKILDIKETTNRGWVEKENGEPANVTLDNLHETADDMFKELGFEKTSGGEKSTVYSHGIHALIFDDKFHFEKRGYIYHGSVTPQLHLAIHQKMIELGWIE